MNIKTNFCALLLLSITAPALSNTDASIKESKRNLVELVRQQYEQILNYDSTECTKDGEVIKEYKKLAKQSFNVMSEAINTLTDTHATEVNNWLKNKMMSPQPKFQEYGIKCGTAGMKLGTFLQEGKSITKEMLREEFSFVPEFTKKEIATPDTELTDLIISLLEKQEGTADLNSRVKKSSEETIAFSQKHTDVLVNFMFEAMVDVLHTSFQNSEILMEKGKETLERNKQICDEVGVTQEELIQATSDNLLAAVKEQK